MIELQQGFIQYFWRAKTIPSETCGLSTHQNASNKSSQSNPIIERRNKNEFYCKTCHKSFASSTSIKSHISCVHLQIKPFSCDRCSYKCGYKSNMIRHLQRNHISDTLECSYCGILICKSRFETHLMEYHRKFRCPLKCCFSAGTRAY